jgi:monoamine oxidase
MDARSCAAQLAGTRVAVVGAGLAGLMTARTLVRRGAKVVVYEARAQVGGRVLSDTTLARGRVIELGAELIGSIHTRWCELAKEYHLSLISRMSTELYDGQRLAVKLTLDRALTNGEIRAVEKLRRAVFRKIADEARAVIDPVRPWDKANAAVHRYDTESVAVALKRLGVDPDSRLWLSIQQMLEHNNVARLEQMNYLSLLCLVRGGQEGALVHGRDDPAAMLMGYWDELELYRCAEGAQQLACAIAQEIQKLGGKVVPSLAVTSIAIPFSPRMPVMVHARSTRGRQIDKRLDDLTPPTGLPYDAVVLTAPPTVWDSIAITPALPSKRLTMGGATKFLSRVDGRFWLRRGAAPYGGSLDLGQIWEGTDNQTIVAGQDTVLSVYSGGPRRLRTPQEYRSRLARQDLYPDYRPQDTLLVDWEKEAHIRTGFSAPGLGQLLDVVKSLHEPHLGRLHFAGDYTQMNHFGYMEGAIRSGERVAEAVIGRVCGESDVRVA